MIWMLILASPVPYIPPTPESMTGPVLHYDCELVDETFRRLRLRFRSEGGRGYWASAGEASRTPRRYTFQEDGTGLLAGIQTMTPLADRRGGVFYGDDVAVSLEEVTPTMNAAAGRAGGWAATLVVTVDRGIGGVQRMTGFCDVLQQDQEPLSDAETREWLRR